MWICSKLGFFSVVRKPDGQFHIRARARQDLENLVAALGTGFKCHIHDTHETDPAADYANRIVVRERGWDMFAQVLFNSVDYPNFKGVIAATPDQRDKLGIYSEFHHAMEAFQNGDGDTDEPNPWDGFAPEEYDRKE
jgi:hypothetical protein